MSMIGCIASMEATMENRSAGDAALIAVVVSPSPAPSKIIYHIMIYTMKKTQD